MTEMENPGFPILSSKRRFKRRMEYKCVPFKWMEEKPRLTASGVVDGPRERSGHRIIYHEGSIYSFGGYNPDQALEHDPAMLNDPGWMASKPLFKELWKFNTYTSKWSKMPMYGDVPSQLASHTATLVDIRGQTPKLMVYGGTGTPYGVITSYSLFMLDLRTFRWEILDADALGDGHNGLSQAEHFPPPLYGQAVVMDRGNDDFYTVGGTSGYNYFIDVHRINMREKVWESLFKANFDPGPNEPMPRYRHELAFHKGRVFVLGGGTSIEADGFYMIHAFHVQTRTWARLRAYPDPTIPIKNGLQDQYPSPRRCHGVVQYQNFVYVFGGYNGSRISEGTWRLNLDTMQWRRLAYDLPEPVYFNAVAISPQGKMFSFGGVTSIEKNTRSKKVFSCWPVVPTLREMCWEALNHYNRHLDKKSVEDLAKEGIPHDLIGMLHGEADSVG